MRRVVSLLTIVVLVMVTACEKNIIEEPGNIPGMGNADGKLQAEAYEFHEDLTFGSFVGADRNAQSAVLKSEDLTITGSAQGSGDQVIVTLQITNNNPSVCRSAWFRGGTVFEVNLEGYQNAILLAPVNVCIPPNTTKTFTLYLYCLNYGKSSSDASVTYEILGVTKSTDVKELIDLLQFKKVNYEHYIAYPEKDVNYNEIKNRLQDIIWNITNRDGMSDSDREFIANLPHLPFGLFPESIYIDDIPLPECWCLDECKVVENSGALSNIFFDFGCDSPIEVVLDEDNYYTTNGFKFLIEEIKADGTIKFESVSPALGEDGVIQTATFMFTTTCRDEQFTVITKNKDGISITIDTNSAGESFAMTNGFMVEFLGVDDIDTDQDGTPDKFTYIFNVVSDSCPGGMK